MTETNTSIYEGLFLFPQSASANMQQAVDHVNHLLARAEAKVLAFSKWDERRLAYDVQGNKRGVYFLVYFEVERDRLSSLERDCNLSEELLRAMITRADHVPSELIEGSEGRQQLEDEIKLRAAPEQTEGQRAVIERAEAPAAATAMATEEAEAAAEVPEEAAAESEAEGPEDEA
ncbi:MAG: 30S ribosomal protein S6 [Planctomycetota bacterium]|nr:30S ribosomal protein S6 [Planctomycetota bacterium]